MPKQFTTGLTTKPWECQTELAWCAGFFDGEGCFSIQRNGKYKWVRLTISQNDRRVLDRFRQSTGGLGIHIGSNKKCADGVIRKNWQYSVTKWGDVQLVTAFLWKFLSPIKRLQASAKFGEIRAYQEAANA